VAYKPIEWHIKSVMELIRDIRRDKQNEVAEWLLAYNWSKEHQYPHPALEAFIGDVRDKGFGLELKGWDLIAERIRIGWEWPSEGVSLEALINPENGIALFRWR
jgi:hypothetical protein